MKVRKSILAFGTLILLLLAACQPAAPAAGTTPAAGATEATAAPAEAGGPCSEAQIKETNGLPDLGGCTLRIAVENAYQPFNFIDTASGKAQGYDYDIFN